MTRRELRENIFKMLFRVEFHKAEEILIFLKLVIAVSNKGVSSQQMLVSFPLIEDVIPLFGRANGVQHIRIALRMYCLLKGLDIQAQVHLVGGNILRYVGEVGSLNGIKEHQK